MSDRDPVIEAGDADQLLNNRLLREAFDTFDKALDERALAAPVRDDQARQRLIDARVTLRKVEKHLRNIVFEGKRAADKAAKDIAPYERRWF